MEVVLKIWFGWSKFRGRIPNSLHRFRLRYTPINLINLSEYSASKNRGETIENIFSLFPLVLYSDRFSESDGVYNKRKRGRDVTTSSKEVARASSCTKGESMTSSKEVVRKLSFTKGETTTSSKEV